MALLIGGAAGCGTHGELGTGSFTYQCVDRSDVVCDTLGNVAIPALMARGSRARIAFKDSNGASFVVTPAAPRLASVVDGDVVFHEAGVVALVAEQAAGDLAADFTHVSVALVDHLALTTPKLGPLAMSAQGTVTAEPIGPSGQALSGALAYTWTSADPKVVSVSATSNDHRATFVAMGPGTTKLTATAGDATGEIMLTVQGAP